MIAIPNPKLIPISSISSTAPTYLVPRYSIFQCILTATADHIVLLTATDRWVARRDAYSSRLEGPTAAGNKSPMEQNSGDVTELLRLVLIHFKHNTDRYVISRVFFFTNTTLCIVLLWKMTPLNFVVKNNPSQFYCKNWPDGKWKRRHGPSLLPCSCRRPTVYTICPRPGWT
jgi:hypothetical protein